MSTILFSAQELANFAALAVKFGNLPASLLPALCADLAVVSRWNARAYSERYSEPLPDSHSETEIENMAIDILAGRLPISETHCPPILYNCDGLEDNPAIELRIRSLENDLNESLKRMAIIKRRNEENARAFAELPALPRLNGNQIAEICRRNGFDRVIEAEFFVDESDSMSDYYGGRCARRVVIGFGKGKRESFKQLRQAAGAFPPAAHLGPGCNVFTVRVLFADGLKAGQWSNWHSAEGHGRKLSWVRALFGLARQFSPGGMGAGRFGG